MKLRYFVMCERDIEPTRIVVESAREMFDVLLRLIVERGPVEWIQRDYRR